MIVTMIIIIIIIHNISYNMSQYFAIIKGVLDGPGTKDFIHSSFLPVTLPKENFGRCLASFDIYLGERTVSHAISVRTHTHTLSPLFLGITVCAVNNK